MQQELNLRYIWLAIACVPVLSLAAAQAWLPCLMVTFAAIAIGALLPRPKRITLEERTELLNQFLSADPHLQSLRTLEPDLHVEVPVTEAVTDDLPPEVLRGSLQFFDQIQVWMTYPELVRSGISNGILGMVIERIVRLTREALMAPELDDATAVQIDYVLLPGRESRFELQAISKNSAPLRDSLVQHLETIPPVGVRFPVVFSYRRCKRQGVENLRQLTDPFRSWRNKPVWASAGTYPEMALQLYGSATDVEFSPLTSEDCIAWQKLGEFPDFLAVEFANLMLNENRSSLGIEILKAQIEISPNNVVLQHHLALVYHEINQTERAAAICLNVLQRFPWFTLGYGFLAHLQLQMQRPQDAWQTLNSAPSEHRSTEFWQTSARVAEAIGDTDTAIAHINHAIALSPKDAGTLQFRAELLCKQRKYAEALEDLVNVEQMAGLNMELIRLKVIALNQLQRPEESITVLSEGLKRFPDQRALLVVRADALINAGKLELAREDCETLLRNNEGDGFAREMRARIHLQNNDMDAALIDSDRAIEAGQCTSLSYVCRGVARLTLEQYELAAEDLETACQKNPDYVIARYNLARAKANLGQVESAIVELDLVLVQVTEWAYARLMRGFLHLNQGNHDSAKADFDQAILDDPSLVPAYRGRAIVHQIENEAQEALKLLDKALLLDPDDAECRMERSQLLLNDNDLKAASKDLDSVLRSKPDHLNALMSRAQLMLHLGKVDDAHADFEAILKDHPDFVPALIGRSVVLEQKGEHELSQQDLDAATSQSPERAQSIEISRLIMTAMLARNEERYDDAIQAASEILAIEPENYTGFRLRASAYWYSDCFVEALEDYSRLIETMEEPDAAALNGRGQVYAELREYELALKDLEAAVELARKQATSDLPYCLSGLGKTLVGLGRLEEADVALRESLSICADNAWLHYNIGLLHLSRNDQRSATLCFELALRLDNPRLSPGKRNRAEAFIRQFNKQDT